ncbi:hypothetical protein [Candidatus Protochlamydia naegleriophila]
MHCGLRLNSARMSWKLHCLILSRQQ